MRAIFGIIAACPHRRVLAFAAIAAALAACSTDAVLDVRPTVDIGQQTAGIHRAPAFQEIDKGVYRQVETVVEPPPIMPMSAQEEADIGLASDLSEAQGEEYAMSLPDEPVAGNVAMSIPDEPAAPQVLRPPPVEPAPIDISPLPPRKPQSTQVAYPRLQSPAAMDSEQVACRRELKKLGVSFQETSPIRDSATCSKDHPVKVSAIGSVAMQPAATLDCRMALTFARWTKKELNPAARLRYLSGVKTIRQGSSYSCRRIAGSKNPSAHSRGMALDVMAIELNNGKKIDVKKQGFFAFRAKGLLNNVRGDGCDYFTTVLGPGYNYDHRDHFHFDLMERRNGHRACH